MANLFLISLSLFVFLLSAGSLRLGDSTGRVLVPIWFLYPLIAIVVTSGFLAIRKQRSALLNTTLQKNNLIFWLSLILPLLIVSDWPSRPYNLFPSSAMRGEFFLGALVGSILYLIRSLHLLKLTGLIVAGVTATAFFMETAGSLLFSDDHTMFLFRLQLLKEKFPSIPFYSPLWNAGFDARDFFATGALNAFFLLSPLVYFSDLNSSYNICVALLLFLLLPLSTYLAAKLSGASTLAGSLASALVLATNLLWYRWALKYGTVGFIVSTALLPLVIALTIRFLTQTKTTIKELVAFVVTLSLALLWTPTGIILLPLGILGLPHLFRIARSRRHLITVLSIILINLPWMMMLWKVSAVTRLLGTEAKIVRPVGSLAEPTAASQATPVSTPPSQPEAEDSVKDSPPKKESAYFRSFGPAFSTKTILKHWKDAANGMNPLILILGIPSLFFLGGRKQYYIAISGWLLALGLIGVSLLPQLELDRMLIVLGVILAYPVALIVAHSIEGASSTEPRIHAFPAILFCGFISASLFSTTSIVSNRSVERYSLMEPAVLNLVNQLKKSSRGGRGFFTGCVVHDLSGGHLAPLATWSGVPLVASNYAHTLWWYKQPIPKSFMDEDEVGIEKYLSLMNATLVFAHEPFWRNYLQAHPETYREIWRGAGFILYDRYTYTANPVVEGRISKLSEAVDSITLTPETAEVVIKHRYFPFLKSSGCQISAAPSGDDTQLIKLTKCTPGVEVKIDSITPINRLLSN